MLQHEERLAGVHPDLARVVRRAAQSLDLLVLEGLRTVERERQLIAAGASHLTDPYRCRHVTGHAVDLGALVTLEGKPTLRWDWPLYPHVADAMKAAARAEKVPIEWGGNWTMRDGPHFQLPWIAYPWTPSK